MIEKSPEEYWFNPERLAYWYFRLNGFLTLENLILHNEDGGPQKTDIDLVAVRFPDRQEALRKTSEQWDWMEDAPRFERMQKLYAVFVEVKTGRCELNETSTDPEKGNLPRVLRGLGAFREGDVGCVAKQLYEQGGYDCPHMKIDLVAIGREKNNRLGTKLPRVEQILWDDIKAFVYERFRTYRNIKHEHTQWAVDGHMLWKIADRSSSAEQFAASIVLRQKRLKVSDVDKYMKAQRVMPKPIRE